MIERYTSATAEECSRLRSVFAQQFALELLDSSNEAQRAQVQSAIADAKSNPARWVLKPQREGGGHNYFGRALCDKLDSMDESERGQYILMQRIEPPSHPNVVIRRGEINVYDAMTVELGSYSAFLIDSRSSELSLNRSCGYLCRIKPAELNEGGVAMGFGALDSVTLV